MKKTEDIGKLIEEETRRRLDIMQQDDYEYPPQATKADIIGIIAVFIISIALIVGCVTGVII